MTYLTKLNTKTVLLIIIILIGGFLRFYKLDWGNGLFTHPDEYHIVASVNQLSFPAQMHPHFFSYGTVTIYLIYLTQELINVLSTTLNSQLSTLNLFLIGRFYSALFSTLTILIIYQICTTFMSRKFSLMGVLIVALTPGLIQQAHFATPESALIFFLFLSLLLIIKFLKLNKMFYLVFASIALGFALGVKVSSVVFLAPLIIGIIFRSFRNPFRLTYLAIISLLIVISTFAAVAPYVFIDYPAFKSNLEYEGGLGIGKIPVFYTRQFINTTPLIFQIEKILPYALGPVILLLSSAGFIVLVINLIKKPKLAPLMLAITFLSLFITNALLFAKWTRFIAPTFPFFAIFAAIFLSELGKRAERIAHSFTVIIVVATVFWTLAFFSIYTSRDIRITASEWFESHTPQGSTFLVEGGNTVDLPLKGDFQRISLSFYDLEDDPMTREKIINALQSSDYFLVQSRRVFMNHQRLPNLYPKTAQFYDKLFNRELWFKQIKEFHSYPSLSIVGYKVEFPDEIAEETWSVFDHPVIRVFKKTKQFSQEDYAKIFEL